MPTFKELGIDLDVPLWFAVYGPAGMAPPTVDKLRKAIDAGFATPDAVQRLAKLGLVGTPDASRVGSLRPRGIRDVGTIVKASGFSGH